MQVENPYGDLDKVKPNRDANEEIPQDGLEGLGADLGQVDPGSIRVTQVSLLSELHES